MERPFPAYKGDEPYIFVSYAHEDGSLVYPEIQWLKDQGFNIWYDEGISPGHEWRDELGERIAGAGLFLYFVTPQSVSSEHCIREVNYAMDRSVQLLVVHLQPTELPHGLGLSLSSIQAIMRNDLSDLDYRIKLIDSAGDHIRRGVGVARAPIPRVSGFSGRTASAIGLAGVIIGGLVVGATMLSLPQQEAAPAPKPLRQFQLNPPEYKGSPVVRISHDGRRIAYVGSGPDGPQIFTRLLSQRDAQPVRGTESVRSFRFAPDDEWLIFSAGGALKKVQIDGGSPTTITDVPREAGFTWGANDVVVYGEAFSGLMRVSAMGGKAEILTSPEAGQVDHVAPTVTPASDAVLFTIREGTDLDEQIASVDLASGAVRKLGLRGSSPILTVSNRLLFMRGDTIWGAPFSPEKGVVVGDAVPVLASVLGGDFSAEGTLIYRGGGTLGQRLVWVDREGLEEGLGAPPVVHYAMPRLSPDGTKLAVANKDPQSGWDIWIYDLHRKTMARLTFDSSFETMPEWSADSRRLVYAKSGDGETYGLYIRAADGTGSEERLIHGDGLSHIPSNWSSEGGVMITSACVKSAMGCDLWVREDRATVEGRPLWESDADESFAALSPDGRWLAYQSNQSGRDEVYVRPYPDVDAGRWQISRDGGIQPLWAPDGGELFYLGGATMMVVDVDGSAGLSAGRPTPLFDLSGYVVGGRNYAVSPEGDRFVMIKKASDDVAGFTIVENWFDELERLAPVK